MAEQVFDTTGLHSWVVPDGITEIEVELYGARGGAGANGGSLGGEGGVVVGLVAVVPFQSLTIAVGAAGATAPPTRGTSFATSGGWGYGGRGYYGAGGGGAPSTLVATSPGTIIARAGAGGGGTPSITGRRGGHGGGLIAEQGYPQGPWISTPGGGEGGTQSSGGRQGFGDWGAGSYPGASSSGGDGNPPGDSTANRGAPGGGGGHFGGGGGGRGDSVYRGAGAGGGSSFVGGLSTVALNQVGGNDGPGLVVIRWGSSRPNGLSVGIPMNRRGWAVT